MPPRSIDRAMAEQTGPDFEDALTRIERIVEDLERGEPALSTALAKYEDGIKLLRYCYDLLDQAERSVALLTGVDDQGHPSTAPFDATATLSREAASIAPDPTLSDAQAKPLDRTAAPRPGAAAGGASPVPDLPF
jgi:exodeoxyribonuclease VII small subunit